MHVVRLEIWNFRGIKHAVLHPTKHNVYLGPNNVGKTTVLEALNLLLNPELGPRPGLVGENDFYARSYRVSAAPPVLAESDNATEYGRGHASASAEPAAVGTAGEAAAHKPEIRIEAVLAGVSGDDLNLFGELLVPWDADAKSVIEATDPGEDPFASAERAIRVRFDAWYNEEEDDFSSASYFFCDPSVERDGATTFTRNHKRAIGFLIYRDFRALTRPITLEAASLFGRLLQSQGAKPHNFDELLGRLLDSGRALAADKEFGQIVADYREELSRYLPPSHTGDGTFTFSVSDQTREEVRKVTQLHVQDAVGLPLQKMGAGTRSLALLTVLLLIARKRGRGILALEEPETFLFPHAQRRIVSEVVELASQSFFTTHSPYVLERVPLNGYQRLSRDPDGALTGDAVLRDGADAKHLRRMRRELSEALLGRGAIVVEEDSVRVWLLRASELLQAREYGGKHRVALELHGATVVAASGNGDVPTLCRLLDLAGVRTLGFLDKVRKSEEASGLAALAGNATLVFHPEGGLERLLVNELPSTFLKRVLTMQSPYRRTATRTVQEADGLDAAELREAAFEVLRKDKASTPFHEALVDEIDEATMPDAFKKLLVLAEDFLDGTITLTSPYFL
jgi:putative ATP-dependent endonuclease of the OLD family